MQNEKIGTHHLFQDVFWFSGYISRHTNFIYELLRLAEKPAINFLISAISSKNLAWGFTVIRVSNIKK